MYQRAHLRIVEELVFNKILSENKSFGSTFGKTFHTVIGRENVFVVFQAPFWKETELIPRFPIGTIGPWDAYRDRDLSSVLLLSSWRLWQLCFSMRATDTGRWRRGFSPRRPSGNCYHRCRIPVLAERQVRGVQCEILALPSTTSHPPYLLLRGRVFVLGIPAEHGRQFQFRGNVRETLVACVAFHAGALQFDICEDRS